MKCAILNDPLMPLGPGPERHEGAAAGVRDGVAIRIRIIAMWRIDTSPFSHRVERIRLQSSQWKSTRHGPRLRVG
jgi:hypothetical protein